MQIVSTQKHDFMLYLISSRDKSEMTIIKYDKISAGVDIG